MLSTLLACWPSKDWLLLGLCVADLTHFLTESPATPNHAVLRAFVDLVVIGHFFVFGTRNALERSKPAIRMLLILVYLISGFHKWNADFLNPAVSCGSQMLLQGASTLHLPAPTGIWLQLAIWGTLGCEAVLPILLLGTRFLKAGLWVALAFHCILALHPHPGIYSFSGLVVASLALWIPEDAWKVLVDRIPQEARLPCQIVSRFILISAALLVLALAEPQWRFGAGWMMWFACAAVSGWALWTWRELRLGAGQGDLRLRTFPIVLLSIFVLNGFAPYLGLQTVRVFSMFSNLRTEGGTSNHLLIGTEQQLFPFQRDLLEVTGATDPKLARLAGSGEKQVRFEIRRWAQSLPKPFQVELSNEAGQTLRLSDQDFEPIPALAGKFLAFRAVDASGPSRCRW